MALLGISQMHRPQQTLLIRAVLSPSVLRLNESLTRSCLQRSINTPSPSSQKPSPRALLHPKGLQCTSCGAQYSTGGWYGRSGGPTCRHCYVRQRVERNISAGIKCLDCGKDSTYWYAHPSGPVQRCLSCHHQAKLEQDTLAGRVCRDCGTSQTRTWYSHPDGNGFSRCVPCYQRAKMEGATLAGRVCRNCGKGKTSQWVSHPDNDGSYICMACYMRAWKSRVSVKEHSAKTAK